MFVFCFLSFFLSFFFFVGILENYSIRNVATADSSLSTVVFRKYTFVKHGVNMILLYCWAVALGPFIIWGVARTAGRVSAGCWHWHCDAGRSHCQHLVIPSSFFALWCCYSSASPCPTPRVEAGVVPVVTLFCSLFVRPELICVGRTAGRSFTFSFFLLT